MIAGVPVCVWPARAMLGEGALWSAREQALYWVDILGRQLHRLRVSDSTRQSWTFGEELSAVAEFAHGSSLLLTLRRGFARFDPAQAGDAPHYLHRAAQEPMGNRFNDGRCDARGRFWGGTMDFDCRQPTGALYCYSASGDCVRHELGFAVTNGPAWSAGGRTIHVNDTVCGCSYAWDFDPDSATLSNRRLWHRFTAEDGLPDGMTTDSAGNLWIAHWGGACVTCHAPDTAAELARVHLPTSHITSCTFGGADLRTLFVTSARSGLTPEQQRDQPLAGVLFAVQMSVPGQAGYGFGT